MVSVTLALGAGMGLENCVSRCAFRRANCERSLTQKIHVVVVVFLIVQDATGAPKSSLSRTFKRSILDRSPRRQWDS